MRQNTRFWLNGGNALLLLVENQKFPPKEQAMLRYGSERAAELRSLSTGLFCEAGCDKNTFRVSHSPKKQTPWFNARGKSFVPVERRREIFQCAS